MSTAAIASRSIVAWAIPRDARMSDASPKRVVLPDPIDPEMTMIRAHTGISVDGVLPESAPYSTMPPHIHADTRTAPLRSAAGHGPEHDQHDRDRPVHHDPAAAVGARRAPVDAGLDRRARDRDVRRHGLERARRGHAGTWRGVRI